ncbi:MAG: transposase [Nitrosopumilaceae archaeon]|nr:transposase [Nitrosopumilaceae archaeon]NIU87897.1 transposase [Nitrosopumilaceae archaeon]NIV65949.1 transposase [Nitrosopumilaceae archaeon]NIX62078.1 transposase [Nitrosopumilaceae archaeon]
MGREQIENFASSIFQAYVKSLPEIKYSRTRNRLLWEAKGIHISLDPHEEVCHFQEHLYDEEGNQVTMMGQLKENRGRKVFRYCTAAIVFGDDHPRPPLTIGLVLMHKGQTKVEVLKRLLNQINKMEVKIDLLSCDGEFYSKDVAECLDNLPQRKGPKRYLIRGSYSKKKDYPGRINGPGFPYEIHAGTKDAYRVEGYLVEQDTPQGKETRFFICSTYYRIHYSEIKQIYKRRFRIENIFRHTRNCKIISSSDNFARRFLLWTFSHFIELLWEIFRILHQDKSVDSRDDYYYRYDLRQKRFLRILLNHITFKIKSIAESKSRNNDQLKYDSKCSTSKDG